MCRKLMFLASLVLLLGLTRGASAQYLYVPKATIYTVTGVETYDDFYVAGTLIVESSGSLTSGYGSTLNGTGARIIVNGGSVLIQGRFNVGQEGGGYITMNGGTFTVTDSFKFPDGAGGVHRIYLNDGIMHSGDIQLYWDRDAIIYVSGGILRLTNVEPGHTERDPAEWIKQGALLPTGEYDEIVIEDKGAYTEVTAVSLFSRVKFETETSEALESVSPALLAVTLSQPVAATVTVDYAVAGGTANIVEDYNLAAGTLTFDPCDINEAISIDIVNDGVNENDETIIVELSNPNGPGVLLGSTSQHTYIILDPRPGVGFDTPSGDGMENVTPADIAVSLSAPLAETVTVEYAVTGGTATGGGVDYTLLGDGTLQFDPCEVTKYISINIVDDAVEENSETTVELTLSNPSSNAKLSLQDQYIYTIVDNEQGVAWDGLVWYYSDDPTNLFVNQAGQLEWSPEQLGQFITRLPEEDFSYPGATVEISCMWMTDGADDCPPDTCLICDRCSDDIRCIAGTSDMRVGLFEADGQYIESDVFDIHNYVFEGYKGYAFRFGPNMDEDIPVRWVDCDGEVHKTGNFQKKHEGSDNLMKINEGLEDYIPGFGLPPGEFSLFIIKLERLSSNSVELSITLNDKTYTWTDDDNSDQPQKIDVLAVHMRNGRPYSRLVLETLWQPLPQAWNPEPGNGARDVPRDVVLTWKPGSYAQDVNAHEVYFGTDFDDVNNATDPNTLPGRGRQDSCSYDPPGDLDFGRTYYWRIDEVNDANIDSPWKGDIWRFTVAEYLVVDDMEPYTTDEPNRIYDTWHDWSKYEPVGGEYPTAAQVTIETADANIHSGKQSMKFEYNNSDSGVWAFYRNISEIDANTIGPLMHLKIGQDWTIFGVKALTLRFRGHPGNDANEQMYVALADSAGRTAVVPYGYYDDEDMNDIKKREWTEWNILLEDFNDINDVNVADVTYVYIGFGDRDNPVVGGSGIVFFDDIRLYPPKCVPSRRKPAPDFSGNCIVELEDFAILGNQWLQPPGSPSADISEPPDGIVNMLDLDVLTEGWLEQKLWPPE